MLSILISSFLLVSNLVVPARFITPAVSADGQTVVLNELLWMGSSTSSADEWIELRNLTNQAVDVSGWSMTKKSSGTETSMLTLPPGATIPAGGYYVISNYANTNINTTLNVVPNFVTTEVALSNSALQIKLYSATQVLMDTVDDGIGNPLSGEYDSAKKMYVSMERNPEPGDGALSQNWHRASQAVGFKFGAVELGTPETINSNGIPTALAGPNQNGIVGQELNFDGSDSSDPENQSLYYYWNFGDGTTGTEVTPKHVYAAAGAYTVALTVSDGGDSSTNTLQTTILPAPAAAPVQTITTTVVNSSVSTTTPQPVGTCQGLHISELYPNPIGVDSGEFIELVNDGDEDIMLGNCAVTTNTTKTYKLKAGTNVPLHGFVLLEKSITHLTLNNTGATVRLLDVDGSEVERVTYDKSKEGQTWSRFGDNWSWTMKPTPSSANILAVEPEDEAKTSAKKATSTTTKTAKKKTTTTVKPVQPAEHVTLPQVQELDSGDRVIISGMVTVPRDALGSTLVYVQTTDGGVSVSIPNGEPTVKLGQEVEITGTVRLKNGRRYVSAVTKGVVLASIKPLQTPTVMITDDVGPDQADQLVQVKGVVSLASGNRIEIDDGSGPVSVYLKSSTGIVRPKVKAGDTVDAIGIVGVSTSGVRVLPRSQEDLKVERVLGASTVAPTQTITVPAASPKQTLWYWAMVGLGAMIASVRPFWRWRQGRTNMPVGHHHSSPGHKKTPLSSRRGLPLR